MSTQHAEHADLLFELGTEELPPLALMPLAKALADGFQQGLEAARLAHGDARIFATPRRLAVFIADCQTRQADQHQRRKGPSVKAAFDADGNPTRAATGFATSCGVSVNELERELTDKGEWLIARIDKPGQVASALLPGIAAQALDRLPIPKRMRWGASEAQFVRPVHWLVFLLGTELVECTLLDTPSDRQTFGHRFHAPAAIELNQASDYPARLGADAWVIPDFNERREHVRHQVVAEAERLGGQADLDEALLDEVTALNEWPVAVSGQFDAAFLEVPQEALILTMKKNQKYFPLLDSKGGLLNHFITIANIASQRPELIAAGNERVITPRLADAKFFWEKDAATTLEQRVEGLKDVVFQKALGSLYDKSQRVASIARTLAPKLGADAVLCERAGLLSRADLNTEMVLEFASMQGIMGRYQALRDGEPEELANAMDEMYMPRYSGDRLPQAPVGIALALADRIDTLLGIFSIGMKPSGDKDPFALRRAALGILRILKEYRLAISLDDLLAEAALHLGELATRENQSEVRSFLVERLKGLYRESGTDAPMFDAVSALRPETIVDFDQRLVALQRFVEIPEAAELAAANKRIRNILKKVDTDSLPADFDSALFRDDAERHLSDALAGPGSEVNQLIDQKDYSAALGILARLKASIDAFFDKVMVMDDDIAIRNNRLALLTRLAAVLGSVADISQLSR